MEGRDPCYHEVFQLNGTVVCTECSLSGKDARLIPPIDDSFAMSGGNRQKAGLHARMHHDSSVSTPYSVLHPSTQVNFYIALMAHYGSRYELLIVFPFAPIV